MARTASVLKIVENDVADMTMAEAMEKLSKNYQAQLPLKAKLKPLEDEAKSLKEDALPLMDAQGVRKSSTKHATISITELEGVVIDDVALMLKTLKREGWEHLITLKVAAVKEYMEKKGKPVPGTRMAITSRFIKLSGIK